MAKETPDFKTSGPVEKRLRDIKPVSPSLGIEDMSSDWAEKQRLLAEAKRKKSEMQEKLAAQKASVEKRKEAMGKKASAKEKLERERASKEALFAFEMAYDKRFWGDKKGSVGEAIKTSGFAGKRLDAQNWTTVHNKMMETNKEYSDAYKATVPLIKPDERMPEGDLFSQEGAEKKPEGFGLNPDEEVMMTGALAIVHPEVLTTGWTDITDHAVKAYIEKHRSEGRDMEDDVAWVQTMGEVDEMLAKEPPVYVADFEKMDLEEGNIISGDKSETVAKKTPPDEGMTKVTSVSTRKPR
ncbi:hypothetical protein JW752_05410 [Candidatus Peregrinibacteria bacterium]|nr:hypothetical protein [Candidatus Peregrinibacteria bacterium]